ncbi:hypothetical protein [Cohaesibacter gelatinilyticus]|uniref:Uncharacterized protein n=1 Tax=Cohaesibacter gelatinilyticus TaxID=372072 RepID=A0A285N9D3_9HYPH|nr:hypothetical protein [Cohaesibacter gelatinilyticus]SNZ06075.1 hypothetical protein SAMN06265368_0292 [Cohaesibacter gelatinilyticus]HAT86965.1 hypothetical protein [Hyphomicrobiales bacterium]
MLVKNDALKDLVGSIADYAQAKIDNGDVSGPRYGGLLKMVWCGTSGEPCYTSCQSMIDAMQLLRELDQCEELDGFFIALTATMLEAFPQGGAKLDDFAALRKMSSEIGKVIPLDQIKLPEEKSEAVVQQNPEATGFGDDSGEIKWSVEGDEPLFLLDEEGFLADLDASDRDEKVA